MAVEEAIIATLPVSCSSLFEKDSEIELSWILAFDLASSLLMDAI
jgi:hypothetical protein